MSDLFLDTLDQNRREVFAQLGKFSDIGVLAGGTALALQIGHRRSFDFDVFTAKPLPANLWDKVRRVFGSGCMRTMEVTGQLNFATPKAIAVTFFHTEFAPLFPTVKTPSIDLFDVRDIATNKAYTIGRRGKWRDYTDLYFLLKEKHISAADLISLSQKRYQCDFPVKLFLEQLCYFDDVRNYEIDFLRNKVPSEKIKNFLTEEVKKFNKNTLL